jgi:hypothetical protein
MALLFVIEMNISTKFLLRETELLAWPMAVNYRAVPGFQLMALVYSYQHIRYPLALRRELLHLHLRQAAAAATKLKKLPLPQL